MQFAFYLYSSSAINISIFLTLLLTLSYNVNLTGVVLSTEKLLKTFSVGFGKWCTSHIDHIGTKYGQSKYGK